MEKGMPRWAGPPMAVEVRGRGGGSPQARCSGLCLRARRAPPAVRTAAAGGWRRRWWGLLGVAVQRALGPRLLGDDWRAA